MEVEFIHRSGNSARVLLVARAYPDAENDLAYEGYMIDITERRRIEAKKEQRIKDLKKSRDQSKRPTGKLPICASWKKVCDDQGYRNQIESYIQTHSEAQFSHGCWSECAELRYGNLFKRSHEISPYRC